MAHPRRAVGARLLQERHPELRARVVYDPRPEGPPATLPTARLAWGAVEEEATHHLVLQDDVELCEGFTQLVYEAIASGPDAPLSLFANWASRSGQMVRLAALSGASWSPVLDPYVPTQALILPAQLARRFADQSAALPDSMPDNQAMSAFLAREMATTYVCCPNLVEHAAEDSLLWHDIMFGVRHSVLFPHLDPPIEIAFSTSVVGSRSVPHFESLAGFAVVFSQDTIAGGPASSVAAHEVLGTCGLSNTEIMVEFRSVLERNPHVEPAELGFGYPFIFQLWLTSFILGAVLAQVVGESSVEALDRALRRPWALHALDTLPAGTLRRFVPAERLPSVSGPLSQLCIDSLRAGFVAPTRWPGLRNISELTEAT